MPDRPMTALWIVTMMLTALTSATWAVPETPTTMSQDRSELSEYARSILSQIDEWQEQHPDSERGDLLAWIDGWADTVDPARLQGSDIMYMRTAWASPVLHARLLEYSAVQAAAPTLEGYHWADARTSLLFSSVFDRQGIPEPFFNAWESTIGHPGMIEALRSGGRTSWLYMLVYESPDDVLRMSDTLQALGRSVLDALSIDDPWALAHSFESLHRIGFALTPKLLDSLRLKTIEAIETLIQTTEDQMEKRRAESLLERLHGAYARNKLVGYPAPNTPLLWSSSGDQPLSLADLKGKVVVLDFWATWCAPCIGKFDMLRRIQSEFADEDVVVLGLTSVQGFVMLERGRVEAADDQTREFELLSEFMAEHDVSWTIAISEQSVFNADFGVAAIPHVAIIDRDGVVRFNDNGGIINDADLIRRIKAVVDADAVLPVSDG